LIHDLSQAEGQEKLSSKCWTLLMVLYLFGATAASFTPNNKRNTWGAAI
jgi:hypothetical protein